MTYGIQLYDTEGNLTLSMTDKTTRVVSIQQVNVGASNVVVSVPGAILGKSVALVAAGTGFGVFASVTANNQVTVYGTSNTNAHGLKTLIVAVSS